MPYRFTPEDRSIEDAVRRIALEQVDRALAELDDPDLDAHDTVHQVRKRCKKLRGLIRLVRPDFAEYARENAALRNAARALSGPRDARVRIETYDDLMARFEDRIDRSAFASIRRRLTLREKHLHETEDMEQRVADFRKTLLSVRNRAGGWQVGGKGFGALAGGLSKTYKRARKAQCKAWDTPSDERFHEWRKRIKYHWYHTRLLRSVWSAPMKARENAAHALGDQLGDHHDLAVFRQTIAAEPDTFADPAEIEILFSLIRRRQESLEAAVRAPGAKLLAEKPKALASRWQAYWTAWRTG